MFNLYLLIYMNLDNLNMDEMLKNPDMLNKAMDMLKNDPKIVETLMNLNNNSKNTTDSLIGTPYKSDEEVIIDNLLNKEYNGKSGLVKSYCIDKERYTIYLKDIDKNILIKEKNIKKKD